MKNKFKILTVLVFVFITKQNIYAQAGTLDPTFGDGGIVIITDSTGQNYSIIQPDGKILIMNSYFGVNLDRFNPDGSYDESFGINGHVNFNFNKKIYGSLNNTIALAEDGKIICAARYFPGGHTNVGIIKFKANGSLDSSFGKNGLDSLDIDNINTATSLVVQPDGKIVVSGDVQKNEYEEKRTFLCRFMPDGGLDPTFGEGGIIISHYSQATTSNSLIIRPDGKIVRGSNNNLYNDHSAYMLESFKSDGSIDVGFGTDGVAKYFFGNGQSGVWNNSMESMILQPDGKIVCIGISGVDEDIFMALCRFNADGTVDASFGVDGGIITSYKNYNDIYSTSVDIQIDGKILTCGNALGVSQYPLLLCRYTQNGQLDPNFGEEGVSTILNDSIELGANNVHYLNTGKILVTGSSTGFNILLMRFNGDNVLASNFKEVKAIQENDNITITWQALNENNTKSYTVERSSNAKDYAGINTIPAKHAATNSYRYTDKNPLYGDNYYRIKENAANGTFTYSQTLKVVFENNNNISLYPNPAKNTVTIKGLNKNVTAIIKITDMNGREITRRGGQNFSYTTSITLSIKALAQGSYFILVEQNGKVTKLRMVKE